MGTPTGRLEKRKQAKAKIKTKIEPKTIKKQVRVTAGFKSFLLATTAIVITITHKLYTMKASMALSLMAKDYWK